LHSENLVVYYRHMTNRSKEFEQIELALSPKFKKEREDKTKETCRKNLEEQQLLLAEYDRLVEGNLSILRHSGVISLFDELIDSDLFPTHSGEKKLPKPYTTIIKPKYYPFTHFFNEIDEEITVRIRGEVSVKFIFDYHDEGHYSYIMASTKQGSVYMNDILIEEDNLAKAVTYSITHPEHPYIPSMDYYTSDGH
jgi:hypothetical protein